MDGFSLRGMRVLITGAAGGIGSAAARICADQGAEELILTDLGDCATLRGELESRGVRVSAAACDVRSRAAVEALCRSVGPVDAAILNAGANPWNDWNDDDWDESFDDVMGVNVRGPINVARALLPGMRERKAGRLVLVGSVAGWTGGVLPNVPPHYVVAKAGVHGLVRWLARRAAPHVLVNAVAPGPTVTGMTLGQGDQDTPLNQPIPRMARPEEIAWPLAFLCSPAASYMTGVVLDVNGGGLMR